MATATTVVKKSTTKESIIATARVVKAFILTAVAAVPALENRGHRERVAGRDGDRNSVIRRVRNWDCRRHVHLGSNVCVCDHVRNGRRLGDWVDSHGRPESASRSSRDGGDSGAATDASTGNERGGQSGGTKGEQSPKVDCGFDVGQHDL